MPVTRALRYVRFAGLKVADVSLDYEALPLSWRGSLPATTRWSTACMRSACTPWS